MGVQERTCNGITASSPHGDMQLISHANTFRGQLQIWWKLKFIKCSLCNFVFFELEELLHHNCQNAYGLAGSNILQEQSQNVLETTSGSGFSGSNILQEQSHNVLEMVSGSGENSCFLERWEDCYVRLLITTYADYKHLFAKGKMIMMDQILTPQLSQMGLHLSPKRRITNKKEEK
ncbi:hypothetical protein OS493_000646 [Desmophyllum pertusum]|uniref:Uncharacterized protein n=1 Tax=Desmophyllum pertusum TaxID=174260 RepID=A0A9X0DBU5_9CNID|nr:hypothetical protein OS493_000646 [Desmophyllum pertusum]